MRRYIILAFLLIAVIALIVWAISQFVLPGLPSDATNSLVVFIAALVGVAAFFAAIVQILDYLQKNRKEGKQFESTQPKEKWFRIENKENRKILSDFLQNEMGDILSVVASGSISLLIKDVVVGDELFIPPPWANYNSGEIRSEDLVGYLIANASQSRHILLLGDPGQGKTTLLKRIFTLMTDLFLRSASDIVPLYFPLRDIAHSVTDEIELWKHLQNKPHNPFPLSLEDFESLIHNKHILFLFDGFDEINGDLHQNAINKRAASSMFLLPGILSCRTNFYELNLSASAIKEHYIEKIVLLPLRLTDNIKKYITAFCNKKGEVAAERIIKTIAESQELLDLAKTSLLLVMVLDIFTDSQEMLEIEWSLAKLYETYTEKWLSNEAAKPGSMLRCDEKMWLMKEIAWSTYQAKAPSSYAYGDADYQSANFTQNDLIGFLEPYYSKYPHVSRNQLIDDICLRTFLIGKYGQQYYFIHKSFQEYYVAKYIFDSLQQDVECITRTFRELIPVEIATFLKDMLVSKNIRKHKSESITENLIATYRQSSGNDRFSVIVRQHAGYYLTCIGTQRAVEFLEQVYEGEPNKWVQRGIMVGLFLSCGRTNMLDHYIDILHKDPEAASINVGYHLVYYGDQPLEQGYDDHKGKKCEGTVHAIFRHLRSTQYSAGWALDLLTLRVLLQTRGVAILQTNNEDLPFLIDFLRQDHKQNEKSLTREKNLLRTKLRRLSLL